MNNGRRRFLMMAGGALGAAALVRCGALPSTTVDGGASAGGSGGGLAGGSAGGSSGGSAAGGNAGGLATDGGIVTSAFAVGSGAFLRDKAYGNPFTTGLGSSCVAYPASTGGPCHSNTYLRQDISDGLEGLPTRFELLVVNRSCAPVPNAIVELWYASPAGAYSRAAEAIDAGTGYGGSLSDLNVGFCTGNTADALASKWLRGYQVASSDGRVTIDGIFPGWYSGRTCHVHFIVTANGQRYVTSQLFFAEALTTAVYTQHTSYRSRGNQDTSLARDNVISQSGLSVADASMSFAQQSDGALVCWKAITVAA
ncbi:MAG: protocatechuate 3,4-dioxygenase [Myxococcaceae bacterium]|nr:protocatechuate 3,4-dioxygenase [Myxococcaceae bacterium]